MKRSLLTILVMAMIPFVHGQEFRETIGNVTTTPTAIASYTGFDNNGILQFSGTADLRNTNTSNGYWNASGTGNVYLSKQNVYFRIDNINTNGIAMPALAFGIRKAAAGDNGSELVIEYSANGGSWTALSMPLLPTGTADTWYYRVITGLPRTSSLSIRFSKAATTNFYFLDDIAVKTKTKLYEDIVPTTHIYKTADTVNNKLDIFLPPDRSGLSPLVPALILFHGGSWTGGDKSMLYNQCQYFAKRGIVTVTANYRFRNLDSTGPAGTREICVRDARSAIRWVKLNAATFGIDTSKIILGGGSAGGHLATMAAVNEADNNDPTDDLSVSTNPLALVLFNPAFSRADAYSLLPYNYIHGQSPSAIMMFGSDDNWKRGGDMLYQSMKAHLDTTELWVAQDQPHGFFNSSNWVFPCNLLADNFLTSLNLLPTNGYSFPVSTPGSYQLQLQAHNAHSGSFRETMQAADSNFTAQVYRYDNRFANSKLVFTGKANVNHSSPSSGYNNASGGSNISLGTQLSYFQVSGINTTNIAAPALSFGIYKDLDSSTASDLAIEYATDGLNWHPLTFSFLPDTTNSARWHYRIVHGLPQSGSLSIRFTKSADASYLYLDDIAVNDSSAYASLHIRGVKWRQYSADEFLQETVDWWLAKPAGSTKPAVLAALATKANAVVFRVDRYDRFKSPQQTNFDKAMNDIVDAIVKAKNGNVPLDVYLWGRLWLERDGGPNFASVDAGAEAVKDWFTAVLNKADSAGVLDRIKGIALIETNCDRMFDVKDYAKRIADKFNANPAWNDSNGNPFFQTRTLMVPGAGFGADFRNVDDDNGIFFEEMSKRCAHFSFIYKLMRGTHETVTAGDYNNVVVNGVNRTWADDLEKNDVTFSVTDRMAYLNHFGLSELTNYVSTHRARYPAACNIVFWGDKWDGISQTQPLTRQAVHKLLVKNGGDSAVNTNYFFDLAACPSPNTSAQKFYLLDSTLSPNQVPGWTGISIENEWDAWPTASEGTMPFYETAGNTQGGLLARQTSGLFDNKNLLLNFGGTATVQNTVTSAGYTQASGGSAFKLKNTASYLQLNSLNTSSLSDAGVGFGIYKSDSLSNGLGLTVKYSTDGNNWSALTLNSLPTGTGTEGWYFRVADGLPASTSLHLRFEADSTGIDSFLVDDIIVDDFNSLPAESFARKNYQKIMTAAGSFDDNNAQSLLWKVAPNPIDRQIVLYCPPVKKALTLTLSDMSGATLLQQPLAPGSTRTTLSLEHLHLTAGVYWLTIRGESVLVTKKLIKL